MKKFEENWTFIEIEVWRNLRKNMEPPQVTARVFKAVQTVDVEALSKLPDTELRPVLASLGMAILVLDFSRNGLEDFMLAFFLRAS